jgi:pseudouridine kinase
MSLNVTVIGTIFVDCKGFAIANYQADSRNLGEIKFVHGGVGRNIAENLGLMQVPTQFISSVDTTGIGNEVVERLEKLNIEASHIARVLKDGMGMWLAILDENGNLEGSISKMPDVGYLEQVVTNQGERIINESSHIVLEVDLNEGISNRVVSLAKEYGKPVYGLPGNLEVVKKNIELLRGMDCFVCNNFEADVLFEIDFSNLSFDDKKNEVVEYANRVGVKSLVVTLGAEGSVFWDSKTNETGYQPVFPVEVVDSSGAGDAFFSGTVMGLVRGLELRDAVVCGTKVAGWTIESSENNCRQLHEKVTSDEILRVIFN